VWINNVAQTLAHLLSFLVVDKAMREDGLRQRNVGGHEETRPDDSVKPQHVFPDNVNVRWPKVVQVSNGSIFVDA